VVTSFMQARAGGSADQAQGFLDAQGRRDFTTQGGPQLLRSTTPKLSRSFTVLSGSTASGARFVERLVLADAAGKDVDQLDETLTLVTDPSGAILVDHAVEYLSDLRNVDGEQPFPPDAVRVPRGKTAGRQRVALPAGYLDDRDDDTPPGVEAEAADSGG